MIKTLAEISIFFNNLHDYLIGTPAIDNIE